GSGRQWPVGAGGIAPPDLAWIVDRHRRGLMRTCPARCFLDELSIRAVNLGVPPAAAVPYCDRPDPDLEGEGADRGRFLVRSLRAHGLPRVLDQFGRRGLR